MSGDKNNIYESYFNYYNDRKNIFAGVVLSTNLPTLDTVADSVVIFGFKHKSNNSVNFYGRQVRIYKLEITLDNKLNNDFIPVIDSSSRPCLYDKVSKICYYNQGTGEFLYG